MSNWFNDFFNGKSAGRRSDDRRTGQQPPTDKKLENPYVTARREWNERYGSYIARARTWQLVALAALGLCAILVMALVKMAGQSRVEPFIVEVDKLGEAVAVKPAQKAAPTADEKIIRFQLASYITNARSVTPDPIVQKRWLDSVYAVSGTSAISFLNDFYKKNDPFSIAKGSMISVEIQTALPLSKTTWQINWVENRRGLNGQIEGMTRWQAVLTVAIYPPMNQKQIILNPTGVVVDQISWTQQL